MRLPSLVVSAVFLGVGVGVLIGCSSSDPAPAPTGPAGGPAIGAVDTHCSVPSSRAQPTHPAACHPGPTSDAGIDAADAPASDAPEEEPYGATMFNAEADDDDCKYHLKYSVTPIRANEDETFTVTTTTLADKKPLMGAQLRAEVFLNDTHPGPNTNQKVTEIAPGVYTLGPVRFDAKGRWTVRFHFNEECSDLSEDSPHGHAGFFVDVP